MEDSLLQLAMRWPHERAGEASVDASEHGHQKT